MSKLSPMMEQYLQIKRQNETCIVFFRLGDFYEMFFEDANIVSKELDLTLTGRDCGLERRAPMCGVPHHSADNYIARLIEKGYKVAICEQVEDAKQAKGIVKREVVRIVTPGTVIDKNLLDENKNNFLASIFHSKDGVGLSYVDVSTGELFTQNFTKDEENSFVDEIFKISPKEIIAIEDFKELEIAKHMPVKINYYNFWEFEYTNAYKTICNHFDVVHLSGLGLENLKPAICSTGALLAYLKETQKNMLNHILSIKIVTKNDYLSIDNSTRRNLELTESIRENKKKTSLLAVLNKTKTSVGARLLRRFIEMPLKSKIEIDKRLDAVEAFKNNSLLREELKELLGCLHDFERTASKFVYKSANAKDMLSLCNDFYYFPHIKNLLTNFDTPLIKEIVNTFDDMREVYSLIKEAISEEASNSINEGGFIKDGYNKDLDILREAKNKGTQWIAELEAREKEKTGIKNLKIIYNKVFGYCIEITNSQKENAPSEYIRRQTLSNCERFITEELKEIEEKVLSADEKIAVLELSIFRDISLEIMSHMIRMQFCATVIATIDVLQSLAEVAFKNDYVRPVITNDGVISIKDGRHPVVEQITDDRFIPNDCYLDQQQNRTSIITGPNMAGKSTFMRQNALIVLMAQMGSFVPASEATIGLVDKIFTRVGASDDLASGQSTFMVEMSEVANILNNATENSLIILDEIGRGTSTYDGLSIAWSVVEYITKKVGAKTLFSTHYHELTEIEAKIDGVNNYHVVVEDVGNDIVFLRKIAKGGANNSYGVHVAKIAGVPTEVIARAQDILKELNSADIVKEKPHMPKKNEVVYYGNTKKKPESPFVIQSGEYCQETLL